MSVYATVARNLAALSREEWFISVAVFLTDEPVRVNYGDDDWYLTAEQARRLWHALGDVFDPIEDGPPEQHPSAIAFRDELAQLQELSDRKRKDYGSAVDPFANVRASQAFGIPPWVGALVRLNDKVVRLQKAASQVVKGEPVSLANEGVDDNLQDIAVYATIAKVLWKEEQDGSPDNHR